MRDDRFEDYDYDRFEKRDIMDRIGDSVSSVFSRKSRKNDKADDLLFEFAKKGKGDDYEFFVDERAEKKQLKKQAKVEQKVIKKSKPKKPVTPLMRKVRSIVASCVIVAVVLIICVVLSLTVLFKTQNYEVKGNTKYDEAEIISTCSIGKNENIFLANKNAASRRLVKAYPYIEKADVSFSIPDTITIEIVEAVPAYIVKLSDGVYYVTSSKGRVLEQIEDPKGYDIPLFLGSELSSAAVGDYIEFTDETTIDIIEEIVTVFVDNGYTGITEIDATDTANISFTYDDRIKVKLGLPESLSYKVRTAMTIITEKLDMNGANATQGELDVSNCNTTKKSYFRDQSLIDVQTKPTTSDSQTATENEDDTNTDTDAVEYVDNDYDGYDDITGEYYWDKLVEEEPTEEETEAKLSVDDWYLG